MHAVTFIIYNNTLWLFRNPKLTCVQLHDQIPGLGMAAAPVGKYPKQIFGNYGAM